MVFYILFYVIIRYVLVLVCPDQFLKEDEYHKSFVSFVILAAFVELDPLIFERRTTFSYHRGDYNKICQYS